MTSIDMPSDTVWVALIGGGVTVSATVGSLWVQARSTRRLEKEQADREDRHRAEDKAWQLRQQGHDERRAVYDALRAAVRDVIKNLGALDESTISPPPELGHGVLEVGRDVTQESLDHLSKTIAQATFMAVDKEILYEAMEFCGRARGCFNSMNRAYIEGTYNQGDTLIMIRDLFGVSERIEALGRRDLGYDAPSTESLGEPQE